MKLKLKQEDAANMRITSNENHIGRHRVRLDWYAVPELERKEYTQIRSGSVLIGRPLNHRWYSCDSFNLVSRELESQFGHYSVEFVGCPD
jgi:hypothetical protein